MSSNASKILVAQGGGPTAVINQSLVGVVLEARKFAGISKVYGAFHGVRGIVNEDFADLTQETVANLERVAVTPSAALGSTRDKPDLKYCQEIFKSVKAHGIGSFFYIGGNDSSDTVRIVSEEAQKANYALRCIHIPKTIDNDLMVNDHTPGFPSAARFVSESPRTVINSSSAGATASTFAKSSPGIGQELNTPVLRSKYHSPGASNSSGAFSM